MGDTEVRRAIAPPRAFRLFEIACVVTCVALDVRLFAHLVVGFRRDPPTIAATIATSVLAFLACDLVAGLVHFVLDRVGTEETPYIGRTFLLPFRSHHHVPLAIRTHDFVETNGNNAFGALLVLVPYALLADARVGGFEAQRGAFVLVFTVLVLLTNQFHKWAHVEQPPRVVALLQRAGILLSAEAHAPHHRVGGAAYCVTSGLWNRILDPIGFFPSFERSVRALLGLR